MGKTDIILGDSNLNGLQSDMLASNSTCIKAFGGAEVHDMIILIHKVPNDYTLAKRLLIHVGYTDRKSEVNKNIANDKMTCLIETARATIHMAKVGLSAVLPDITRKESILTCTIRSCTSFAMKMGLNMWI